MRRFESCRPNKSMQNNLDSLIQRAAEKFDFNAEKYPELTGASEAETERFAIRHASMHFAKTAGKIISHSEDVDHGGEGDLETLKNDVAKSLLNTLRLAGLLHMTEKELIEKIENRLGDSVNSSQK